MPYQANLLPAGLLMSLFLALGIWFPQILLPFLPDFAVPVPVVQFAVMQGFKEFLIAFGLELLCETWQKLARFRSEQSGLFERPKVLDDCSKCRVQAGQGFVNLGLLGNINRIQVCLHLRGSFLIIRYSE